MVSRIIIKGTIAILIQRKPVARKIQALFKERGMDAIIVDQDNPKLEEFCKRGQGLLVTDTYFGFRPIHVMKQSENIQVAVVFLKRPRDAFDDATLKAFGSFVVGIFEEEMDEYQLEELIKLAVKYESDVDPAIYLDDEA